MKKLDYSNQHFKEMSQIDLMNVKGGGFWSWLIGNLLWESAKSVALDAPVREGSVPQLEMSGGYYVMPSDNA